MNRLSYVAIAVIALAVSIPAKAINPLVLFAADYVGGKLLDQIVDPLTGEPDPDLLQARLKQLEEYSATRPEVAAAVRDLRLSVNERVTKEEFRRQVQATCERLTSITDRLDAIEIRLEVLEVETEDLRYKTDTGKSSKTFVRRAARFAKEKDFHRALANLNRALALNSSDRDAYLARARLFLEKEQYGPALVDAAAAVDLNPHDAVSRQLRIDAAMRCADYEQAVQDGQYFINVSDDPTLQRRGSTIIARAQSLQAGQRLDQIGGKSWESEDAKQAAVAEVRRSLEIAVEFDASFAPTHYYLSKLTPDLSVRIAEMKRTLELDPACLAARYELADLYWLNSHGFFGFNAHPEDLDKAIETLNEIIAMQPESRKGLSSVYVKRGGLFARAGRNEEAVADFTKGFELDPTHSHAIRARAWALRDLGRVSEADRDQAEFARLETLDEVKARIERPFEVEWTY